MTRLLARIRWMFNLWPPFLLSGIHVTHMSPDWRYARVELRMRPWNRNYVGTHFGGSLFAMTDPFVMLLALHRLGRDYLVWDRAAEIEFVKAVREPVYAEFRMDDDVVAELRGATAGGERHLRWFEVPVTTEAGDVVARVRKQLYVRRKRDRTGSAAD